MSTAKHIHYTSFADARPAIIEEFVDDSCKEKHKLQISRYKRVHSDNPNEAFTHFLSL